MANNNVQLPKNDNSRKIIEGYYLAYFGRTPSAGEYNIWYGKGSRALERALINNDQNVYGSGVGSIGTDINTNTGRVTTSFRGQPIVSAPISQPSGTATTSSTGTSPFTQTQAPTPTAPTPGPTGPLGYDDWLKTVQGSNYQDLSEEGIRSGIDPFFEKQLGGVELERTQAQTDLTRTLRLQQEDLTRTQGLTRERVGREFNQAGLFGSGIFQKEQGRALEDLSRADERSRFGLEQGFQRTYGEGEYTPYNIRKFDIEQQRTTDIAGEGLAREGRSRDYYTDIYLPEQLRQ